MARVLCVLVALGMAAAQDSLPGVAIKLAPPSDASPEVQAELAKLVASRRDLEKVQTKALEKAYDAALASAKLAMEGIAADLTSGKSVAFLQQKRAGDEFDVQVNVLPVAPASAGTLRKIQALDTKLKQEEAQMYEQAMKELNGLSEIVLSEVRSQIGAQLKSQRAASFVQTQSRDLPSVANVVVGAAAPFATTAGTVALMEAKQSAGAAKQMANVLAMEKKLLKELNSMVQTTLGDQRALASAMSMVQTTLVAVSAASPMEAVAAAEGVPVSDLLCVKDFSGCPEGWADFEGSCSAPASYDGPCPAELVFAGSPKEKSLLAAKCGASYPCVDACAQDFAATFSFADYSGPCVETDFTHWSAAEKAAWGQICGAAWPCA